MNLFYIFLLIPIILACEVCLNGIQTGKAIVLFENNRSKICFSGFKEIVDEETLFEIGSISKVFTALILLELIENKTISSIDDSINNYLPQNVSIPKSNFSEITFRHLITHTSTFPKNLKHSLNIEEYQLKEFINNFKVLREPGENYLYSNLGYMFLGYTLQNLVNKTFDELVFEVVTSKLNMFDTKCFIDKDAKVATGHLLNVTTSYFSRNSINCAAGGLFSNIKNLKRFLIANIKEDSKISNLLKKTYTLLYSKENKNIGYAWHFQNKIIFHAGGTYGFSCYIGFKKEEQKGILILSNYFDFYTNELSLLLLNNINENCK